MVGARSMNLRGSNGHIDVGVRGLTLEQLVESLAEPLPVAVAVWIVRHLLGTMEARPPAFSHGEISRRTVFVACAGAVTLLDPRSPEQDHATVGDRDGGGAERHERHDSSGRLARSRAPADVLQAVGIVLWELVARRPFPGGAGAARDPEGPVPDILELQPSTDPALAALCDRAVSLVAGERFGTASEMRRAIDAWLETRAAPPDTADIARLVELARGGRAERAASVVTAVQPSVAGVRLGLTAPATLVGRIIGSRYRLERLIGSGGMGAVFEATQLDLQRKVAVKLLDDVGRELGERLRREALTAGRIASPHVVSVFDFQASPGEPPILVMELLEGESVSEVLRRETKLSVPRAVRIASQVLLGLEAAHRAGVVHRDVKPSNVWLQSGGVEEHVKVLDFGVARIVTDVTSSNSGLIGTPSYVAPEQLRGLPADPPADLHAVGVLLFEMLSGSVPWRQLGMARLTEILSQPPPLLDEVVEGAPRELAHVVACALSKAPADRYRSAEEMRRALAPFVRESSEAGADAEGGRVVRGSVPPQRSAAASPSDTTAELTIPPFERRMRADHPAPPPSPPSAATPSPDTRPTPGGRLVRALGTATVVATLAALGATVLALPGRSPPPRTTAAPGSASAPGGPPAPSSTETPELAPPDGGAVLPEPKQIALRIRARPKDAHVVLDGKRVANPHEATVLADRSSHILEVALPGYVPQVRHLRFEDDVELVVSLVRAAPAGRRVDHPLDDGDPYR